MLPRIAILDDYVHGLEVVDCERQRTVGRLVGSVRAQRQRRKQGRCRRVVVGDCGRKSASAASSYTSNIRSLWLNIARLVPSWTSQSMFRESVASLNTHHPWYRISPVGFISTRARKCDDFIYLSLDNFVGSTLGNSWSPCTCGVYHHRLTNWGILSSGTMSISGMTSPRYSSTKPRSTSGADALYVIEAVRFGFRPSGI
jgi:hypothetical protein